MLQLRESAVTPILLPFWTRCGPSGPHGISPACHDHGGFRTLLKTEIELTGFNHGRFSATSGSLSKGPIAGGVLSSISAASCKLQCSKHDFSLTKNNQRPEKVVDFSAGARRMPVRRKKKFFFSCSWMDSLNEISVSICSSLRMGLESRSADKIQPRMLVQWSRVECVFLLHLKFAAGEQSQPGT